MDLKANSDYFPMQLNGFIIKTEHVYCVLHTESLKTIPVNCSFKQLTYSATVMHIKLSLQYTTQAPETHPLQIFHTLTAHKGVFLI